jgi:serine protease Do
MSFRSAFFLITVVSLTGMLAFGQEPQAPPPPEAPMPPSAGALVRQYSFLVDGGGYLGVQVEDINKENVSRYGLRQVRGVGVKEVVKDSPAEKAGLRKDDVIVGFDGETVSSARKLTRLVSEVAPDHTTTLTISRSGVDQQLSVTIGKRENHFTALPMMPLGNWKVEGPNGGDFVLAFGKGRRIGVTTTPLTGQLAEYFGVADGKGVLITSVTKDSPAAKAGIKAGDVIIAADGKKIERVGDLTRAINEKKEGAIELTVVRDKAQRTISVEPKEDEGSNGWPQANPQIGRRIVIPRIELPSIPEMNIVVPQMNLPVIPPVQITLPQLPKVKIVAPSQEII